MKSNVYEELKNEILSELKEYLNTVLTDIVNDIRYLKEEKENYKEDLKNIVKELVSTSVKSSFEVRINKELEEMCKDIYSMFNEILNSQKSFTKFLENIKVEPRVDIENFAKIVKSEVDKIKVKDYYNELKELKNELKSLKEELKNIQNQISELNNKEISIDIPKDLIKKIEYIYSVSEKIDKKMRNDKNDQGDQGYSDI